MMSLDKCTWYLDHNPAYNIILVYMSNRWIDKLKGNDARLLKNAGKNYLMVNWLCKSMYIFNEVLCKIIFVECKVGNELNKIK